MLDKLVELIEPYETLQYESKYDNFVKFLKNEFGLLNESEKIKSFGYNKKEELLIVIYSYIYKDELIVEGELLKQDRSYFFGLGSSNSPILHCDIDMMEPFDNCKGNWLVNVPKK